VGWGGWMGGEGEGKRPNG